MSTQIHTPWTSVIGKALLKAVADRKNLEIFILVVSVTGNTSCEEVIKKQLCSDIINWKVFDTSTPSEVKRLSAGTTSKKDFAELWKDIRAQLDIHVCIAKGLVVVPEPDTSSSSCDTEPN